jgi:hypothetical protein
VIWWHSEVFHVHCSGCCNQGSASIVQRPWFNFLGPCFML